MIWMLVGALAVVALLFWWSRRKRSAKGSLSALRRKLRKLVHDDSVVNRLIDKERERHPELSEVALIKKVLRRLSRDRR